MKYQTWLNYWFKNYVQPSSKPKTCERYAEIINKRLIPKFADYDLNELTPLLLQNYVSELSVSGNLVSGRGLSSNSINVIITVIQNSLKFAYVLGEIPTFTANKIKRPPKIEKEILSFTLTEQKKIEKVVLSSNNPKLVGIILCLYTGIRIGELLALTWADVDFKNGYIIINKTCHYGKDFNGKYLRIVSEPKTISSKRIIPVPPQILKLLKWVKKSTVGENVVCGKSGNAIDVRSYQKTFSRLLKKINVDRKGFHSLRHTFATRAIECGMDVKTLSEILGHKNATVTLNRYAHSMMRHKIEMMRRVGKLL